MPTYIAREPRLISALTKIPYYIPRRIIPATRETIEEVKRGFKEPSVGNILSSIIEGIFFPASVAGRTMGHAVARSFYEAGYSPAHAETLARIAEVVTTILTPGSAFKTVKFVKPLLKSEKALQEAKALKEARVAEFLEGLGEGFPKRAIDIEKLSPKLRLKYEKMVPEIRERMGIMAEKVYPLKKKLIEEAKPIGYRVPVEIFVEERGGKVKDWFEMARDMKRYKEAYKGMLEEVIKKKPELEAAFLRPDQIDFTFELLKKSNLNFSQKMSAWKGLIDIMNLEVPIPSSIMYLRMLLGEKPLEAFRFYKKTLRGNKEYGTISRIFAEIFGVTRAIQASADMSALLRQALPFIGRKEWFKNIKSYIKAFKSEANYDRLMADIITDKFFPLAEKFKLGLTELGTMTRGEELFLTKLASHIPLVAGSERGYIYFLNKTRFDVFKDMVMKAAELGYDPVKHADVFQKIANYVNIATGRGWLPKGASFLSHIFFAPRLATSRLQFVSPFTLAGGKLAWRLPKGLRMEYARDISAMATFGLGSLFLSKLWGGENVDIELDPRNADFLKIRMGNFRLDPWGGFQQEIVLTYRVATGEAISSTTGKPFVLGEGYGRATRWDMIFKYLANKLHPIVGETIKYLDNKMRVRDMDYIEAFKKMLPFFFVDVWESAEEDIKVVPYALLGAAGMGVQVYGINDSLKPSIRKLGIPEPIVRTVDDECDRLGVQLKSNFSIDIGGVKERVTLTESKLTEVYKNLYLIKIYEGLYDLINNPEYQNLSDIGKLKVFNNHATMISKMVKQRVLGFPVRYWGKLNDLLRKSYYIGYRELGYKENQARELANKDATDEIRRRIIENKNLMLRLDNLRDWIDEYIKQWKQYYPE